MSFSVPDDHRIAFHETHPLYSRPGSLHGAFLVNGLWIIASSGLGWEHVSVSKQKETPSWDEMCLVKDLFWGEEDAVMQLHPRKSVYRNHHPHCLHLWRPTEPGITIPEPPAILVAPSSS